MDSQEIETRDLGIQDIDDRLKRLGDGLDVRDDRVKEIEIEADRDPIEHDRTEVAR